MSLLKVGDVFEVRLGMKVCIFAPKTMQCDWMTSPPPVVVSEAVDKRKMIVTETTIGTILKSAKPKVTMDGLIFWLSMQLGSSDYYQVSIDWEKFKKSVTLPPESPAEWDTTYHAGVYVVRKVYPFRKLGNLDTVGQFVDARQLGFNGQAPTVDSRFVGFFQQDPAGKGNLEIVPVAYNPALLQDFPA